MLFQSKRAKKYKQRVKDEEEGKETQAEAANEGETTRFANVGAKSRPVKKVDDSTFF